MSGGLWVGSDLQRSHDAAMDKDKDKVMQGITRVEINFPEPVQLPPGFDHIITAVVGAICADWEINHPGYVMWPAGIGAKAIWNKLEEPTFNRDVYCIDCVAREESDGEKAEREARQKKIDDLLAITRSNEAARKVQQLMSDEKISSAIASDIEKMARDVSRFLVAYPDRPGDTKAPLGEASWTIVAEPFDTLEEALDIPSPQIGWGILHVIGDIVNIVRLHTSDGWVETQGIQPPASTKH